MKRYLVLVFLLTAQLHAELIDGPANVREKANGKLLFELNDSTYVEASENRNDWHYITLLVRIKYDDMIAEPGDDYMVKPNAPIYSENGGQIGVAKTEFFAYGLWKSDSVYADVVIWGYTFKNNIYKDSIAEYDLQTILDNSDGKLDVASFEPYFEKHRFEKGFDEDGFLTYSKHGPDLIASPDWRVMLIFYERELIGIMYQNRLDIKHYKLIEDIRSHKIVFFENASDAVINTFKEKFYTIIKLAG